MFTAKSHILRGWMSPKGDPLVTKSGHLKSGERNHYAGVTLAVGYSNIGLS
jgi:hypothetical protein